MTPELLALYRQELDILNVLQFQLAAAWEKDDLSDEERAMIDEWTRETYERRFELRFRTADLRVRTL